MKLAELWGSRQCIENCLINHESSITSNNIMLIGIKNLK